MRNKITVLAFLVLWIQIHLLYGQAPSNVILDFNKETRFLDVKYEHQVGDATQHYIAEVKILLNEKEIIVQSLISPDDNNGGSVVYKIIDAKPGDEIKVQLKCSRAGSKSASVRIE